jgi:methyltransferase (TIGR00027 family)
VAAGVRQYVILGAGLDSFAYRQPAGLAGVTIYELDHPDTQQWKRRRLAEAGLPEPGNLRFVAVDFTRQCLQERLVAAGLRCAEPAFFSWVGVTYYLTRQAFLDTLRFIGTRPSPSAVVFDFALRDAVLPRRLEQINTEVFSFMEDAGEPWRLKLTPKNITGELRSIGFREIRYLSPAAANERYLHKRRDGLRTGPLVGLMHAIV